MYNTVQHTCRSVKSKLAAISILLGRHKYLLKWNSFSSSSSCVFVYAVRRRRGNPFSATNSAIRIRKRRKIKAFSTLKHFFFSSVSCRI